MIWYSFFYLCSTQLRLEDWQQRQPSDTGQLSLLTLWPSVTKWMVATKRENTSARQAHFEFPYSMFVVHCSPDISIISYTFVDCDHPSSTYILSFKKCSVSSRQRWVVELWYFCDSLYCLLNCAMQVWRLWICTDEEDTSQTYTDWLACCMPHACCMLFPWHVLRDINMNQLQSFKVAKLKQISRNKCQGQGYQ